MSDENRVKWLRTISRRNLQLHSAGRARGAEYHTRLAEPLCPPVRWQTAVCYSPLASQTSLPVATPAPRPRFSAGAEASAGERADPAPSRSPLPWDDGVQTPTRLWDTG